MHPIDWLVSKWFERCRHAPENVLADLLEGDAPGVEVKYCRRCGAVSIRYQKSVKDSGAWRSPRPLWHPEQP